MSRIKSAIEINLFGIDLELNDNGDFICSNTGDIQTVVGLDNMKAAIEDRLGTESNELIKHIEYGIPVDRIIGESGDAHALDIAKIEIMRALSLEPRIKEINSVELKKTGEALYITINAILIDQSIGNYFFTI